MHTCTLLAVVFEHAILPTHIMTALLCMLCRQTVSIVSYKEQ
jgi:hypothetical protein